MRRSSFTGYVLAALVLLAFAQERNQCQPNQTSAQAQREQPANQPSPTPLNPSQAEIDNAAKTERESYEKERDRKEDVFKTEQANQNRIVADATFWIAVFGALSFIAVSIYAFFSYQQWQAIEEQAKVAREAFHVGEAPYFGIAQIAPEGFDVPAGLEMGYVMSVKVTFTNGGKTPAWHFHSKAKGIIGKTPDDKESYNLETQWHDMHNTFFRTNDSHTFEYKHGLFRYSRELEKRVESGDAQIFVIIKAHYMDFRKKWHPRDFRLVWDERYRNFRDYDAEEQRCKLCQKTHRD